MLKQGADGVAVAEICRKVGISQATYLIWKKRYNGLLPTEMRRLKQLEDENAKLKRIVADLTLDKKMLQDVFRRKLPGSGSWWEASVQAVLAAAVLVVAYAALLELMQFHVEGRTSSMRDLAAAAAGGLAGVLLFCWLRELAAK